MKRCIILFLVFSTLGLSHAYAQKFANDDSLVVFAKRYMEYMENLGSKGTVFKKTYVRRANHTNYQQINNLNQWPDSIAVTVNVIYYKGEATCYIEVPVVQEGDVYRETSYFFYHGRLIVTKEIFNDFKSSCVKGHGLLDEKTKKYYDSTGRLVKTESIATDDNNKPVDTHKCGADTRPAAPIYWTYKETPLNKYGVVKTGR